MHRSLFILVFLVIASCSEITRTKDELTQNAQVYAEDAFSTLQLAKDINSNNTNLHERSVAQIVFPKAVKGALFLEETMPRVIL